MKSQKAWEVNEEGDLFLPIGNRDDLERSFRLEGFSLGDKGDPEEELKELIREGLHNRTDDVSPHERDLDTTLLNEEISEPIEEWNPHKLGALFEAFEKGGGLFVRVKTKGEKSYEFDYTSTAIEFLNLIKEGRG